MEHVQKTLSWTAAIEFTELDRKSHVNILSVFLDPPSLVSYMLQPWHNGSRQGWPLKRKVKQVQVCSHSWGPGPYATLGKDCRQTPLADTHCYSLPQLTWSLTQLLAAPLTLRKLSTASEKILSVYSVF